jgi:Domain of unknown function (DUF4062)
MAQEPLKIFVSAVTSEFGKARDELAADLRARGHEVAVQSDLKQSPNGETLLGTLAEYIRDCNAVICIVGNQSGACPPARAAERFQNVLPTEIREASYAHWEFFLTRYYRRQPYLYIARQDYVEDRPPSPNDRADLQSGFLAFLKADGAFHGSFSNVDQLARAVLKDLPDRLLAPSARRTKSKARTKIGKAVEANEKEINLAVAGLLLQIDAKVHALRGDRPNSHEAIAERDAHITEYERMRGELEHIRAMIGAFKKGTEKEASVVRSLKIFADGVRLWWNKNHDAILTKTFDMGLFTTAVGICSMAGAGGNMAVAVSAVLVGGKPVGQALKGLVPKRFIDD